MKKKQVVTNHLHSGAHYLLRTTGGSLIVTVFFGLTPVISRPNALELFSFVITGSEE